MSKEKTKTIKINHRNLGTVAVKVDAEDADLFKDNVARIATFNSVGAEPRVRFYGLGGAYAARVILEKHNKLDYSKNVFYKNNKHFDLRKSNLIQI